MKTLKRIIHISWLMIIHLPVLCKNRQMIFTEAINFDLVLRRQRKRKTKFNYLLSEY